MNFSNRMRILIATPYLPWPLTTGGNAAQFSTLKCLADDHQFTLLCPVFDEGGMLQASELQIQLPQVLIRPVFCGFVPIHKSKSLMQVARSAIRRGRNLLKPRTQEDTLPSGPRRAFYPFDQVRECFVAAVQEEMSKGVDLCQVEFVDMLSLGVWLAKFVPTLFIHHQVHFVYSKRFLETQGRDAYADYLDEIWQVQEIAYLKKFNGVVTFSEEDRKTLLPWLPPERVYTSPFPIPADVGIARDLPSKFDGRFLFLASEEHGPNLDALEWLLAEIWPEILKQLPSARLVVIGTWSETARNRLKTPGLNFAGFVRDLAANLRGGIMLVPLRIGSGIRVKIMVAMAQGVPVVSTPVGSEGMLVRDGEDLLVRGPASEFVAAAVQLARDEQLWLRLSISGKAAITRNYSADGVRQKRNEIYRALAKK